MLAQRLYSQCSSGAFPSKVQGEVDETCFLTASVVLLLDPKVHSATISQALDFIERCECPNRPGAFKFYPHDDKTPKLVDQLPPDADDTALAWLALLKGQRRCVEAAREAFNSRIAPASRAVVSGRESPWVRSGAVRTWLVEQGRDNPVDLTVNANVAGWAAAIGFEHHPAALGARDSLIAAARGGYDPRTFARRLSPYYADISELFLAVRRAIDLGASQLHPALDWLAPVAPRGTPWMDKPLYCNSHGMPVWHSPALQAARFAAEHGVHGFRNRSEGYCHDPVSHCLC